MKKETLEHLLVAEMCKASSLWAMQENIGRENFEYAMRSQFEYLYWFDEAVRLQERFHDEWWDLRGIAHGVT